ncbi:MAG: sulfotransferase family 2 domain-containing protein [bacterium]|nr:sulfotransferase family 2 domain-containing protein [bacterium]
MFPRIGLAYNRVKKNANSATMAALFLLETGRVGDERESKLGVPSLVRAAPWLLPRLASFHYFTIVRNPYSRVLSAFLNKFAKPEYLERYGPVTLDRDGFSRFIAWLEQGALGQDMHWDLQCKLLMTTPGEFDSVLEFEAFPMNLVTLLNSRGVVLPDQIDGILGTVNSATRTGAGKRLQQFYTPAVANQVQQLFRRDFDQLRYSTDFEAALLP